MKLLHIQNLLYGRPLLITRAGFNSIHEVVQAKLTGRRIVGMDDTDDMPTNPEDEEQEYDMSIEDGVAWIPIQGPIGRKLSLIERICGACDIDILREQIDLAKTYPDVETICFCVDSPGGSVDGVPDLAEYIAEVNKEKPCIACIEGMCCSAAYYLVAGCSEIIACGKTCYIGSVGTYCYLLDTSRQYQNEGIDPVLVKAGEKKGELMPGMKITADMIERLQKEVDYINGLFLSHVKGHRPNIPDSFLNGQAYYTEEALKANFVDGVISNKSELFPT